MKASCVKIETWTSSFRYPNLISGFHPTLEVPPISTVMGLLNAASGKYIESKEFYLGYYFDYKCKAVDLETIYQIEAHEKKYPKNIAKSNVIQREFLYDCRLFIYLTDEYLISCLKQPVYPLLLGRSCDLARVESIKTVELKQIENATIAGQVIPFMGNYLPGQIQALPQYFTNTIPRKNLNTAPYTVISFENPVNSQLKGFSHDTDEFDSDIFLHEIKV
ncbi:type I-B CRISPR-associated protein Cas5b [uncultured Bacteroides sp.]|uniref:type I-B CRISPR-associated protein Cas5b n=1 Tax=uncultured Bacteroides sp. TaxID=162156 RepID=UPI002AAC37BE|nr:type I-B CRISPR-associated protein Cas5b [uncultured Bacteroides sp.]